MEKLNSTIQRNAQYVAWDFTRTSSPMPMRLKCGIGGEVMKADTQWKCPYCGSSRFWFGDATPEDRRHRIFCADCGAFGKSYTLAEINENFFGKKTGAQ